MRLRRLLRPAFVVAGILGAAVALAADTLVLRDGRRIQGELVAVRDDTIEFREGRGFLGGRLLRLSRDEVQAIEFDRYAGEGSGPGGRPSGMREREVVVSADVAWNDTGIDLRAGQTVYFEATGRVTWGPGRRDGPAGEGGSPYNQNRPIPRRPAAALIGKSGPGDANVFFIGDERGPIRVRASGRLFLGVNDDFLDDNRGNLRVTIYY